LKNAEEQLSNRFKTLANEILEDKPNVLPSRTRPTSISCWSRSSQDRVSRQGAEVYVQEAKTARP
jgi:hypothetical protein